MDRYEKKRMKAIMRKYQLIYSMFGGEKGKAPNIEIPEIRLPMISLLKKQISKLSDVLYHAEELHDTTKHIRELCCKHTNLTMLLLWL